MAGATSGQEVNDQSCLLDCCIEVNEYHVSVAVFFETFATVSFLSLLCDTRASELKVKILVALVSKYVSL